MLGSEVVSLIGVLFKEYRKLSPITQSLVGVVLFSFLLAFVVLGLYFFNMDSISKSPEDWGSFGALLSGVFTFTATMAAVATLIAFQHQIKEQGRINASQLEINKLQYRVLLSDQYERHRAWFCQKMDELEKFYGNKLEIHSKTELYGRFFPGSRPDTLISKRELRLDLPHYPHDLEGVVRAAEVLKERPGDTHAAPLDVKGFSIATLWDILDIFNNLNINCTEEKNDGMVLLDGRETCVNILNICESLGVIERVLNAVLEFGDSSYSVEFSGQVSPYLIRDKMLREFRRIERSDNAFKIFESADFRKVVDLYFVACENRGVLDSIYIRVSRYLAGGGFVAGDSLSSVLGEARDLSRSEDIDDEIKSLLMDVV